ncbi:Deoxyribonuclease V [Kribbella flavida DSM 17836]|uniref:Endonuclease V n=1 Tax=Kribbella flavida (strain DSM 17836 / JCM 10339 / NBRC 14399) TaxID=479435 RepID=D2PZ37_KRIFD|nr:endonuclease V [Kribbella flavida]ADB31831.1 Deoxyribonuclease V [Kribbella flavida DSM 17836]
MHTGPETVEQAIAVQESLRSQVDTAGPGPQQPRYVAGLDVAYAGDEFAAAVVVLDGLEVVDRAVVLGRTAFPYVPGLFAFREVPGLLTALERLRTTPELLVCDGQGLAHPRRFGLACHLGVVTGLPSVGVAKTAFVGTWQEPGPRRGDASELLLDGEVVGKALRTQNKTKPVFVSVGHRVDLATAVARVLDLTPRYRLPETTRAADRVCRQALKDSQDEETAR